MLADRLAGLSAKQRAVLEMRLQSRRGARPQSEAILRRDGGLPAPLSSAQQRLWFLDQLEPGSSAYNLPAAVRLAGELDVRALAAAFGEIVRRHEVLRTTFAPAGPAGEPVQVVSPPPSGFPLPVLDLSGLDGERVDAEARRLLLAEAGRPFDLARGPLFRARLLRLGPRDHLVAVTLHHTVGDGWSMGILLRELAALYGAFRDGRPAPLAELPVQYGDYARWQRARLAGGLLDAGLAYWRERLRGLPAQLELPADRPRPAAQSARGGSVPVTVDAELAGRLRALWAAEGATPFMGLLAGFAALLAHGSCQEDLAVGSPVAGRHRPELEGLIGLFVNTLVLRADLAGDPTPRELLRRIMTTTLDAYAHQEVPFERLVEELSPERSLSRTPLFQAMFVLHNAPVFAGSPFAVPGLRSTPLELSGGDSKFDLHLSLVEVGDRLSGTLEYSRDLFEAVTAARLVERFGALLAAVAAGPDRPLSELPRLAAAERQQLLAEWNATAVPYPPEATLPGLFAARAARAPERRAVVFEGLALSYRQLDRQTDQLARRLRRLGVGPETAVAVALDRSLELVVALLAVLKAGGAYVPLDPAHPDPRLAAVLADLGAPVVLTAGAQRDRFAGLGAGPVLCLDADRAAILAESPEPPDPPAVVRGDALAYVLFTSGSTGVPKGAMNTHAGIANRLLWMQEAYRLDESDRVLQKTPFTFDVSVWELFWPLIAGARLVVARPEGHRDPDYLLRVIAGQGVTTIHFVPSMLQAFLDEPDVARAAGLRRVFASGEALPAPLVERFFERLPGVELHNLYGPTEAAVDVTFHACTPAGAAAGAIPIGRPIANLEIHLLDRHAAPVPPGTPGELHIGGAGLARGYLGRPDLTAERFVPWRGGARPGGRLYRTGDLARHRPDGALEFLGRIDHQVKIRGFRVEPGEIEAALARHPAVREAVVVARDARDKGGAPRLAAYVVPAGEEPPAPAALRAFLGELLPAYMVPDLWAVLDALPLTASGKVDRKALPEPGGSGASATAWVAPRDLLEQVLADLWSEVLGRSRIGAHDDFFALGGHSLLATRLASRARAALDVEIPLRTLFEAPTPASLAERIRSELRPAGPAGPPLVPAPVGERGRAPLSFAQQRLWFLDQLEPGSAAYNLPAAMRMTRELDVAALAGSLGEIVRRHEALRTVFPAAGGEPVQVVRPTAALGLPLLLVDLSRLAGARAGEEARRLAAEEAQRPFDLAAGPLFRARLLRFAPRDHVVLATMHHIVSDGWSMEVLLRELTALYGALHAGRPSPLAPLPVQYADFARWQRQWLAGETLAAEVEVWRRRLAGMPARLELPTDRPRPAVQTFAGASRPFVLGAEVTAALRELARRERATLFMALLASLQVLLARISGQESLGIGTAVAGRNRLELEGLIGLFANTLVLRADLDGDPTFREVLGRARRTVLEAHAHQDLPFEKLVEELAPERSLAHTPLFQVMFAFQNAAPAGGEALDPDPLALAPFGFEASTAKFDLTLLLAETGGGVAGKLEYNRDLFDAPTIGRLLAHLDTLLAAAAGGPDARAAELPLLTAAERRQILAEWNDTARGYDRDACLHEPFEAWARRTPQATAVLGGGGALTYAELDRRANQLARHLIALGAGPGTLVAISLGRTPEMAVALLGILKAGAAYVPVEASWPEARIAWILGQLGVRLVVADGTRLPALRGALPGTAVSDLVRLDRTGAAEAPGGARVWDRSHLDRLPEDGPGRRARAGDLAYVIFTSGTTGSPKGVVVRHRPAINLIEWVNRTFAVGPADRVLFLTALGFDLSVYDVFGLLAAGGSVRVASDEEVRDPRELLRILHAEPVTFWDSAPAALQQLVPLLPEAPAPGGDSLRLVFLSGDWIPVTLPDRVRRSFPNARVIALGGATEATVWSNFHPVGEVPPDWASIPYGRPIQNARYHVLDERLGPCPVRVAGDLYIGGECLSAGYLGDAELTAGKYVPDLFSDRPGDRLYRTGDRARHWPDGTLEFLGRRDHQVKIRGFRVELGEIEAVLGRHPAVREAAVLAREGAGGHRQLVAYAAARPGAAPSAAELREHLARHVPEYMVPAAVVLLEALPVTANGKLDRKALPDPAALEVAEETDAASPRTPLEELLAGIWAEVLGRESVGLHASFFDLGGHSLLATQVSSRVQQALGVELPLRRLFERPTVAGLAAFVAAARREGRGTAPPPLAAAPRTTPAPLSFAQERLWFLDQLQPGDATYNVAAAVRLAGRLDTVAFAAALDEIARRHEALRTTFHLAEAGPVQVVAPEPALAPPLVDLRGLPRSLREREAARLAREEGGRPFHLSRGPLARAVLLRLEEEEHAGLLTLHHTVSDAWSMGVLLRELAVLYASFSQGRPSPLPALPIQYGDFAAWQRRWLTGGALAEQLAYWRERLGGAPPRIELPTDRPHPAVQTFRGARLPWRLPAATSAALGRLGRREGATLFMTLLAAFQALLARATGQEDVLVASPSANRGHVELEGLIGLFVNTLVLRLDLSGDPGFAALLARAREATLGAYEHQDLPFEKLVEELRPERSLAHSPLAQVMLILQNAPTGRSELPGLTLEALPLAGDTAKFEITLELEEASGGAGGGLSGVWEYNRDLFDAATVARMAGHFESLLRGIVADPARPVADLPLLSPAEEQQLREWNATGDDALPDVCLHGLFEAQAARTPEATALVAGGERLTYRELDRRAGRLARRLRSLGVGPEVTVGLCATRSAAMVAALLAILKAGGAYVPLDPMYPAERLGFMLDDAGSPVLLAQRELADRLAELPGGARQTVWLDPALWEGDGDCGVAPGGAAPGNLAYLIYTSGSTGRPKGVPIEHRSAVVLARWAAEVFSPEELDGVLLSTSICFDLSIFELFVPLAHGGKVILAENALALPELAAAGEVRLVNTVPSAMAELVQEGALPASVRTVNLAGEPLPRRLVEQLHATGTVTRVYNLYGPSEDTTYSTFARVAPGGDRIPPIGRPVAGTRAHLLDAGMRPVPAGVPGEVYLAGAGLARGYFGRPERTAERFLPDPFAVRPGERLYRTGDRALRRPDGELEYLGRIDHQVKVRGFRIELGEIEAALASHPAVQAAAVLVRDDAPGGPRLVAYTAAAPLVDAAELRERLRARLPEHMVPAAFVSLEALPLTPNGKVDRRALLSLDGTPASGSRAPHEPPATAMERRIAEIWRELLGIAEVGVDENFFDLGGHSLLVLQLQRRLREVVGRDLSVVELFRSTTISALARLATERQDAGAAAREGDERAGARRESMQRRAAGRRALRERA